MNLKLGVCLAVFAQAVSGCVDAVNSRSDKPPVSLDAGLMILDGCLASNIEGYSKDHEVHADDVQMGIIARHMGAVGPSCQVFFATDERRDVVMAAINERGQFVKFVDVPFGRLAMYRQTDGDKFFLTTEPKRSRGRAQQYEALVVAHDPT